MLNINLEHNQELLESCIEKDILKKFPEQVWYNDRGIPKIFIIREQQERRGS